MEQRIHLIAPSAPPRICGVGDHSFLLGNALSRRFPTMVHCGQIDPSPRLPGLEVVVDFDSRFPWTLVSAAKSQTFRPGDMVFFQYTNFAYGRYGFNPWLAPALRRLRGRGLKVATMFHETYMPAIGIKIRMMGAWQRSFFRAVGNASDVCFFSIEPWAAKYAQWFPNAKVRTLKVGSNIPVVDTTGEVERTRLGIDNQEIVLMVFGGTHPSRLFEWIVDASTTLASAGIRHRVVHVGPDREEVGRRLQGSPLLELGILDPQDVSRAMRTADIFLSPISDGASSRRGSLLAGLNHGLCCITTTGDSTDRLFHEEAGRGVVFAKDREDFSKRVRLLALDAPMRRSHGDHAARFYEANFSWESIAETYLRELDISPRE